MASLLPPNQWRPASRRCGTLGGGPGGHRTDSLWRPRDGVAAPDGRPSPVEPCITPCTPQALAAGDGWTKASGGLTYRDCGGYGGLGGKQVQALITRVAYALKESEAVRNAEGA